jgi:F0F1-type ATP synthase membrane subunit c/vacuolar-type H+-ATPase subunit K
MDIEAARLIGGGLAAIGVTGAGIGIGIVSGSFAQAVGRNPAAEGAVSTMTWVGVALSEATALYALAISLMIIFS